MLNLVDCYTVGVNFSVHVLSLFMYAHIDVTFKLPCMHYVI